MIDQFAKNRLVETKTVDLLEILDSIFKEISKLVLSFQFLNKSKTNLFTITFEGSKKFYKHSTNIFLRNISKIVYLSVRIIHYKKQLCAIHSAISNEIRVTIYLKIAAHFL